MLIKLGSITLNLIIHILDLFLSLLFLMSITKIDFINTIINVSTSYEQCYINIVIIFLIQYLCNTVHRKLEHL